MKIETFIRGMLAAMAAFIVLAFVGVIKPPQARAQEFTLGEMLHQYGVQTGGIINSSIRMGPGEVPSCESGTYPEGTTLSGEGWPFNVSFVVASACENAILPHELEETYLTPEEREQTKQGPRAFWSAYMFRVDGQERWFLFNPTIPEGVGKGIDFLVEEKETAFRHYLNYKNTGRLTISFSAIVSLDLSQPMTDSNGNRVEAMCPEERIVERDYTFVPAGWDRYARVDILCDAKEYDYPARYFYMKRDEDGSPHWFAYLETREQFDAWMAAMQN